MKVDIIIPVKEINPYIYESIPEILRLEYNNYGIIIFPDSFNGESFPHTRIIPTGSIGPAEKRDLAIKYSTADILAFLDDDAYPRKDWLKNAVIHFHNPDIAAVGGPAVTPPGNSFWQRVSGAVFLSRFGGGNPERYWPVGNVREIDDWPSVNLLIRRDILEKVGGFNSVYWPGEDTKLCLDIIKTGKKIIYDPKVLVYHHRREGLIRHLMQVGRYGLHRGFFAKRFPETSKKIKYFLPSLFVIFLILGTLLFFLDSPVFSNLYYTGIGIYILTLFFASYQILKREGSLKISLVSLMYIYLTHIWYGIRFLQGYLFTRDLKSKLRKEKEL
jgi:cellulose synthase/poly-beta-1,6-N-acetylglucosamine synthase-like glycosyltransferase